MTEQEFFTQALIGAFKYNDMKEFTNLFILLIKHGYVDEKARPIGVRVTLGYTVRVLKPFKINNDEYLPVDSIELEVRQYQDIVATMKARIKANQPPSKLQLFLDKWRMK